MQTPDYFEFLNYPKIISGQCALENLPSELEGYDAQKPLVITAKSVGRRGLTKKFIKAFYDSTVVLGGIYDEVRDYAGISQAQEAAQLFKARGCDAIIALGDGPVVDLAKAINILVSENMTDLRACYEGAPLSRRLKPLMVVPACCFNGLEASNSMTVDNRRIVSDVLFPEVFVMDGRMTAGCSAACLAETGIIALTQAIAALTVAAPNPMTDAVAHAALSLLAEHLPLAVRHPANRSACLALANAAVMAATAHCNTVPGLAHLTAEALSHATGITRGKLLASILPAVLSAHWAHNAPPRDELYLALAGFEQFAAASGKERSGNARGLVLDLVRGLGHVLPLSLQALRIQSHILHQVAQSAAELSAGRFTATQCHLILTAAQIGC